MSLPQLSAVPTRSSTRGGFTLVELLVVVGIIGVLMALAVPAFNTIRGGNDFSSQLYDISGTLERARSYAMSSNSYVLVGIIEVSNSTSPTAANQPAVAAGTVGGRITMAVVASKAGTRPYQSDLNSRNFGTWSTEYGTGAATAAANGSGFIPVGNLMQFQGIHLVDLQGGNAPAGSNMARSAVDPAYNIPNALCSSSNSFGWPIGTKLSAAQYKFAKVIEFDPQGSARILSSPYWDAIPHYIEIGLQPTHGATATAASADQKTGQIAAIQIDGMSGAIRLYRP